MRLRQSNSRNASNAKNASRSARIGCICALVKRATRHSAATARQTGMQASTRMPADIRSSHPHNPASAGCTVIRMMRFANISCCAQHKNKTSRRSFLVNSIECACYFICNGYATAWKSKHDHIGPISISGQLLGQKPPCVPAITKRSLHVAHLMAKDRVSRAAICASRRRSLPGRYASVAMKTLPAPRFQDLSRHRL
jgi:hypothetical protein